MYKELNTDILEDFMKDLSETTKTHSTFLTGKGGAIEMHLFLTESLLKEIGTTEEEIEKRLKKEKIQLEKELSGGMYEISTDPTKDYIKKIPYEDRW